MEASPLGLAKSTYQYYIEFQPHKERIFLWGQFYLVVGILARGIVNQSYSRILKSNFIQNYKNIDRRVRIRLGYHAHYSVDIVLLKK